MDYLFVPAVIFYLVAIYASLTRLLEQQGPNKNLVLGCAGSALVFHAAWLYHDIFIESGQNLSMLNVAALVSLIICTVMTLAVLRYKIWVLLPVVYGFAIINLSAASVLPSHFITHLETQPQVVVHITLALFAYSTLLIASLFAIQMAYLDYQLKNKKRPLFNPALPPLMTVEKQLFQLIFAGVILLSLSLASGFIFLQDMFVQGKAHKAVFSIIAWFMYVTLLWGHYRQGWRGRPVIYVTIIGAFLLTLAYFGSRFVKEVLLV